MADEPTFEEFMKSGAVPLPAQTPARAPGAAAAAPVGGILLPPIECGDGRDAPETCRANGISARQMQQLQRSQPDGTLDLHGLTVAEAHMALENFLRQALRRGWRVVEVIHGRGLHGGGEGKLRCKTRHWMAGCDCVLAYCAPVKNSGALLALLRQRRRGGAARAP